MSASMQQYGIVQASPSSVNFVNENENENGR